MRRWIKDIPETDKPSKRIVFQLGFYPEFHDAWDAFRAGTMTGAKTCEWFEKFLLKNFPSAPPVCRVNIVYWGKDVADVEVLGEPMPKPATVSDALEAARSWLAKSGYGR